MAKKKGNSGWRYFLLLILFIIILILALMWLSQSFKEKEKELIPKPQVEEKILQKKEQEETQPIKPRRESHLSADKYHFKQSFDFGWPDYALTDTIIEHLAYALSYNEDYEQANWVAWQLLKSELGGENKRKDHFIVDPLVKTGSAHPNDYKQSGFDRGHLAPAADFSFDEHAMEESFYMSNMSPQAPELNRGIWKELEEQTREWAQEDEELYIVTGPIFSNKMKLIGENKVAVPTVYFKVILDLKEPELKAIAFLIKNEGSKKPLEYFAVSIDSVEVLSGLNFFPLIPDSLEEQLESNIDFKAWFE